MSNYSKIQHLLHEYSNGKYRFSDIEYAPESDCYLILIPKNVKISDHAKMMMVRRVYKDIGVNSKVVRQTVANNIAMSEELFQYASKKIPDLAEASVSIGPEGAFATLVVGDITNVEETGADEETKKTLEEFFKEKRISLVDYFVSRFNADPPSDIQILKTVSKYAPATLEQIVKFVEDEMTSVPSEVWMRRALDRLRRNGFVLWQKNQTYVLTSKGIGSFPQLKGKRSPNIAHALELKSKKW